MLNGVKHLRRSFADAQDDTRKRFMIPKIAKKVFTGIVFDVYHWPQKMFDGTTETFEVLKRQDACNIIAVTEDKRILYQSQQQPHRLEAFGCLPGGGIEEGESALEGAKRELLEETGYTSDDWELRKSSRPGSRKIDWAVHTFIARDCRKVAEMNLDAGEKIDLVFLTLDELLDHADRDEFEHTDLKADFVRAKYDEKSRKELESKLFG